jgi:hypothetical protein
LVTTTVQLDHTALMELNKKRQNSTQNLARVYLYSMEVEYGFLPPRVQIDGKSVGRFAPHQYACVSLVPGTHSLRTGRTEINVGLAAGQDYFVRLESHPGSGISLEVTDALESQPELLTPANISKDIADNCLQ